MKSKLSHIAAFALFAALAPMASVWSAVDNDTLVPDVQLLSRPDPQVRKATAIVNGAIITDLDIEQRLALVVAASGGRISQDERGRLRVQILRNLIDERLQIAEAKAQTVDIDDAQVEEAFKRVSNNFGKPPVEFAAYLRSNGASPQTLKDQIRAELAWSRVLRRKVEPLVNVGDDEVQAVMTKMEATKGQEEYHLGEIFISAPPERLEEARAIASRIVGEVRKGSPFVVFARQYSEASTAALGGDMGWVMLDQLNASQREIVQKLRPGEVSDPVVVTGGIALLALQEKREVMGVDPLGAVLTVKQMSLPFDPAGGPQARTAAVQLLQATVRTMGGCGGADAAAKKLGGDAQDLDPQPLREFPKALQEPLAQLQIGQGSPVFGTEKDVRLLVLCGRDEPTAGKLPSFDEVYAQLNDERVQLLARRYLRDLRRDAIVDYR